jgi:hypothetical protein
MKKRIVWAVFACALAAGATLFAWRMQRGDRAAPPTAAAAEERTPPKPAAPRVYLEEHSPAHPVKFARGFVGEVRVGAGRHVFPGGETRPYVYLVLSGGEVTYKISPDSAADLVRLADRLKGQKKPEAKEVGDAWVYWQCEDVTASGHKLVLWYDVNKGNWGWNYTEIPAELIDAVRAALKDHEALARVKPSVQF